MVVHLSNLQRLLKNGQKSDSFAAHFVLHFNTTTSRADIRKYMTFKVVKQLNPSGAMNKFTKPNFNLCMQECLTILKKLRDKRVTVMNKNLDIYGACRNKTTFHHYTTLFRSSHELSTILQLIHFKYMTSKIPSL